MRSSYGTCGQVAGTLGTRAAGDLPNASASAGAVGKHRTQEASLGAWQRASDTVTEPPRGSPTKAGLWAVQVRPAVSLSHTLRSTECLSAILLVRVGCRWKPLPGASAAAWKASGRRCFLGGICASCPLGARWLEPWAFSPSDSGISCPG